MISRQVEPPETRRTLSLLVRLDRLYTGAHSPQARSQSSPLHKYMEAREVLLVLRTNTQMQW